MSEQRNIIIDNIDFSEALRYLGYGNSTPDEKTKEILYNCADQLKSVMEGKYTYKVFDLVDGQVPGINFTLEGKSIANHLKNCEKVREGAATGSALVCCAYSAQTFTARSLPGSLGSCSVSKVTFCPSARVRKPVP